MKMAEKVKCTTLKKMIERMEQTTKASNGKLDMLCSEIMGQPEKLVSQVEANNKLKRSLIFIGQELDDVKNENNSIKKKLKVVNLNNEKLTKKVVELEVKEKAHHFQLNKTGCREIMLSFMGYLLWIVMKKLKILQ